MNKKNKKGRIKIQEKLNQKPTKDRINNPKPHSNQKPKQPNPKTKRSNQKPEKHDQIKNQEKLNRRPTEDQIKNQKIKLYGLRLGGRTAQNRKDGRGVLRADAV